MVKIASKRRGKGRVTGNETNKHVKYRVTKSRGPIKFKISTMTSVGNLEESIFLHGLALA